MGTVFKIDVWIFVLQTLAVLMTEMLASYFHCIVGPVDSNILRGSNSTWLNSETFAQTFYARWTYSTCCLLKKILVNRISPIKPSCCILYADPTTVNMSILFHAYGLLQENGMLHLMHC